MMWYMVIEHFRPGCKARVYERFRQQGRMLPDGLEYVASWPEQNGDRCFQLMKTAEPELFERWVHAWDDLVEFEMIPIEEKPVYAETSDQRWAGQLKLSAVPGRFAVVRLTAEADLPAWAMTPPFYSITRTEDELSLVCPVTTVPPGVAFEGEFCCLKVHGPLAFDLTGVLASLSEPLSRTGISLFAVSTFDTDYILVRADDLKAAATTLRRAGHSIEELQVE